jgi:hypothetical protein
MKRNYNQVSKIVNMGLIIFLSVYTTPAYAYVDPGSGSVIVTTVLGMIAAIGYTFRKFFYNMRAKIFGKKRNQNNKDDRSLDG